MRRSGVRCLLAHAAIVALLACGAAPAMAQKPTAAQQSALRAACRADFQAQCSGVPTGGAAALTCLQQHQTALSAPCNQAVAAVGGAAGESVTSATPPDKSTAMSGSAMSGGAMSGGATTPREKMGAMRAACGADFHTYCQGIRPGGGRAMQCLQEHSDALSPGCHDAMGHAAP